MGLTLRWEEIVFRGYEDQEREEFLAKLSNLYEERLSGKKREEKGKIFKIGKIQFYRRVNRCE